MKHALLIMLLIVGMAVNAQKKTMPQAVKESFELKYPNAENVKFKAKKENVVIRFKENDVPVITTYNTGGEWQKTETTKKAKDVPAKVSGTLSKKYPNANYSKCIYVEDKQGGKFYKVSLDSPAAIFDVEIGEDGKIIKATKTERAKDAPSGGGGSDGGEE